MALRGIIKAGGEIFSGGNVLDALGDGADQTFASMPFVSELWEPVHDCVISKNREQKTRAALKYQWLQRLAPPVSIGVGLFAGVYAVLTYGPLPAALLAAPVSAGLVYLALGSAICWLQGQEVLTCMTANFSKFTLKALGSVTSATVGIDVNKQLQSVKSYERKLLGCQPA